MSTAVRPQGTFGKIIDGIDLLWPVIVLLLAFFFGQHFKTERNLVAFIVDVGLLNTSHVIFSFIVLYVYNRESGIIALYREKHDIGLIKRLFWVAFFYTGFFFYCNFSSNQMLKDLDLLAFSILQIDHSFQQSKGLFLKRIKEKYSAENYVVLKKAIDALKWSVVALVAAITAVRVFPGLGENAYRGIHVIYFSVVGLIFVPVFTSRVWKKSHLIKLFSMRFLVLIFSTMVLKLRGFYHGPEYMTILAKINTRYFSGLADYPLLLKVQLAAFLGITLFGICAYSPLFIQGLDAGIYLFPVLKSLTVLHFALDHYIFTQRYIPAQKITAIL